MNGDVVLPVSLMQGFLLVLALLLLKHCDVVVRWLSDQALVAPPSWARRTVATVEGPPLPTDLSAGSTPPGTPQSGLEALLVTWAHFAPIISGDFERKVRYALTGQRASSHMHTIVSVFLFQSV